MEAGRSGDGDASKAVSPPSSPQQGLATPLAHSQDQHQGQVPSSSALPMSEERERERDAREAFGAEVKQHFETLVKQGLEPNDAAALALKLAAKIGESLEAPRLASPVTP